MDEIACTKYRTTKTYINGDLPKEGEKLEDSSGYINNNTNSMSDIEICITKGEDEDSVSDLHSVLSCAARSCGRPFSSPDLLFKLLSCLPFPDLCRLRLTCKSFKALLSTDVFWRSLPAESKMILCRNPYIVAVRQPTDPLSYKRFRWAHLRDLVLCYNTDQLILNTPSCNDHIKLATIPLFSTNLNIRISPELGSVDMKSLVIPYNFKCKLMVSSSGGLLCTALVNPQQCEQIHGSKYNYNNDHILDEDDHKYINNVKYHILVVNPLTGASKLLPPPPVTTHTLPLSMIVMETAVDEKTGLPSSYCIMILYNDFVFNNVNICLSTTGNNWTKLKVCVENIERMRTKHDLTRIQNAALFFNLQPMARGLLGYDAQSATWFVLPQRADQPWFLSQGHHVLTYRIHRYKGRIFYIAMFMNRINIEMGIAIWEMKEKNGYIELIPVSSMPVEYCRYIKWDPMGSSFICAHNLVCALYSVHHRLQGDLVLYDLDRVDSWHLLQDYKADQAVSKLGGDVLTVVCFLKPSL